VTVSVVIASENHAPFIAEAMESALAQTGAAVELIVVDCGSTDRTRSVLESVMAANPDARIELVTMPAGGHPALARNRGVEVASGERIVCLEPYDTLAPDFVESCGAALDADPGAGFAYTDRVRFGAASGYEEAPGYDFEELLRENYVGLVALFRRSAWEEAGGFDAQIPYDDWDFWIGCADRGHHGVRVAGTAWHQRVRTNGRFRSSGLPEVRRTRAELMQKRPHLYSAGQHAWADVVLAEGPERATAAARAAATLLAEPQLAEVATLPAGNVDATVSVIGEDREVAPELISPGELVLQVGAAGGDLTATFLELGARVVAVEPDPGRARLLRERLGDCDGLVVVEKAVGSWEGAHESAWPQPMLVQMTTLARLIEEHGVPALCQVDSEGFADHVLAGLDRPLPYVGFRFNAGTLREARVCAWRLAALGMTEFNYADGCDWASDAWMGASGLYAAFNAVERDGIANGHACAYARPRAAQPCSSGAIVSPASFNSSQ
jgi:hypothetical protein